MKYEHYEVKTTNPKKLDLNEVVNEGLESIRKILEIKDNDNINEEDKFTLMENVMEDLCQKMYGRSYRQCKLNDLCVCCGERQYFSDPKDKEIFQITLICKKCDKTKK